MEKIPYSGMRSSISQYVRLASRINPVQITAEIPAPGLRAFCAERQVTLTPVLMKIIADTARQFPLMRALLARNVFLRKKIYIPDAVSIAVAIEKEHSGEVFVLTPVIFSVDQKPLAVVSRELENLAQLPLHALPDMKLRRLLNLLPSFFQYLVMRCIIQSAYLAERFFGSVGISNLGAYGIFHFAPVWVNTVVFGVGSLYDKPVATNGQVAVMPVLHLGLSFNHCVIDGALAGRMLAAVRQHIEEERYREFD